MNETHTVFMLAVAEHEQDPQSAAWRAKHAADTFGHMTGAWFTAGDDGKPLRAEDGTYELHAPLQADTVRDLLIPHEGMRIVREFQAPGLGLIVPVKG